MIPPDKHLEIGSLAFDALDQMDLTGPFEVLAGLPNSTHRIFAKTTAPVRDVHGLKLVPDALLADAPQLDVLHIPGGFGQEALMEDEDVLGWIRRQAKAHCIFAVCTGVLICGAAGLIKGRQATTHWSAHHLLPFFGAVPVNKRVVVDGNMVFAAWITSGIDGALYVAAMLRGEDVAKSIQLDMEYAPEPPFNTGTPETAPADILDSTRHLFEAITAQREATARRIANRLGVSMPART
jgi:cyclohexyl-isocyanide hydratase